MQHHRLYRSNQPTNKENTDEALSQNWEPHTRERVTVDRQRREKSTGNEIAWANENRTGEADNRGREWNERPKRSMWSGGEAESVTKQKAHVHINEDAETKRSELVTLHPRTNGCVCKSVCATNKQMPPSQCDPSPCFSLQRFPAISSVQTRESFPLFRKVSSSEAFFICFS